MAERKGLHFKMMIMQWGPIPPSGGPFRDRFLDHHGRESLNIAEEEYAEVLSILGENTSSMPVIDFELVGTDETARRAIQRAKRGEWFEYRSKFDAATLDAIQPHIKKSTSAAMDALNYLEDHPLRENAHSAIHRAAFIKRGLFGCPISYGENDEYWTDCPINLSHLRMGVSAGLMSDFECSVCGTLVEDCDHQMGEYYPKTVQRDQAGLCTVCREITCEHQVGETVSVPARANARNARASEVSMVARPRYPLARMVEKSIDLGEVGENPMIREAAELGALNCDADLGPCIGFNEMKDWDLKSVSQFPGGSEQVDLV